MFHCLHDFFTISKMESKIRLLVLTHNYPRFEGDYSGVFISLLTKQLAGLGVEPIVLAPHDREAVEPVEARPDGYEQTDGVTVYRFRYADDPEDEKLAYRGNMEQLVFGSLSGPLKFRRFLNRFRSAALNIIKKERIQVVAGHWLVPSGMVMKKIASDRAGLPMILSSHGTDIRLMKKHRRIAYPYFKRFCRGLKKWTVVSSFLKEEIIRLDSSLAGTLEVLPLPHNEAIFYKDGSVRRESDLVVSVTRFTGQKRVDYLVKAFATVVEKRPQARLEIYGSGPLQADIERLIKDLDLQRQVTLFPPVRQEELRKVYNRAAIVVLNSFEEGFGLTLSEAMLCGATAVGTDSGGIPDIIKHQKRGVLVPLDDSAALAEAILELLDNSPLRRTLADNGYRFARENYASGPLAARYAQMVREALR